MPKHIAIVGGTGSVGIQVATLLINLQGILAKRNQSAETKLIGRYAVTVLQRNIPEKIESFSAFLREQDALDFKLSIVCRKNSDKYYQVKKFGLGFQYPQHGKLHLPPQDLARLSVSIVNGLSALADHSCDYVVSTIKSHPQDMSAEYVRELYRKINASGRVVWSQNGIPPWFIKQLHQDYCGRALTTIDPQSQIADEILEAKTIGAVLVVATMMAQGRDQIHGALTGVANKALRNSFWEIGSPDMTSAQDLSLDIFAAMMTLAGLTTRVRDIRPAIARKLQVNIAINPLSALVGLHLQALQSQPMYMSLMLQLAHEVRAAIRYIGIDDTELFTEENLQARLQLSGKHLTSMAQDVAALRPLEYQSILSALIELVDIAAATKQNRRAVPYLSTLRMLNRSMTCLDRDISLARERGEKSRTVLDNSHYRSVALTLAIRSMNNLRREIAPVSSVNRPIKTHALQALFSNTPSQFRVSSRYLYNDQSTKMPAMIALSKL